MKKIGIFYGSSSGTTEGVANDIAAQLGVDTQDVHDVASADVTTAESYEALLLGSSTWGFGDLQDDWAAFLPKLAGANLSGKVVALFGCGDSSSYADTFCDALAEIKEQLAGTGCSFVGAVTPEDYEYESTRSEEDGKLIGCCIDEMNQSDLTAERIENWLNEVKKSL